MPKPIKKDISCKDCKQAIPTMVRIGHTNALLQACDPHLNEAVSIIRFGTTATPLSRLQNKK